MANEDLRSYAFRSGALEASLRAARNTMALAHTEIKTPFVRDEFTHRLTCIDRLLSEIAAIDGDGSNG